MSVLKKIRILSRKSDLAVIQARQVGKKIQEHFPTIKIEYITKKLQEILILKHLYLKWEVLEYLLMICVMI